MIRIAPNRCGYTGYKCQGHTIVPTSAYARTELACDRTPNGVSNIDNYADLPVNIAGFTMQDQSVVDLSGVAGSAGSGLGYAEILCYAGLSVVAADGASTVSSSPSNFMNLYSRLTGQSVGLTYHVANVSNIKEIKASDDFVHGLNCYAKADKETLTPAPLEPIVPSVLPQIVTVSIPPVQLILHRAITDLSAIRACFKKISKLNAGVVLTHGGCEFYTKQTATCPPPKKNG